MAEQKAKKKKPESGHRMSKRFWFVAFVILALAIGSFFLFKTGLLDFQTVDEQLAAFEAARAIPDAENAAIIYNKLLVNYDEGAFSPEFMDEDLDYLTLREPWLSKDYPELAEWFKDRQDIISTLMMASKMEKCRFSIITDYQQINIDVRLLNTMREWTRLLIRAVNNDIAEGRIDAGIQKCNCLIQMGKHLCQQPVLIYYMIGIPSEALALDAMKTIILQGETTEDHLNIIEAAIPQTKDNWAKVSSKIIEFETLYERKNVSLFKRAGWWLRGLTQDVYDLNRENYLRYLANRRGCRILIALRRYRNKNGRWPKTLDGIKDLVPEEILVDPINGGSFVYKLTEENFILYSKGKNNIDEGGLRRITFDPNEAKRPQIEEDDFLICPTSSRKS